MAVYIRATQTISPQNTFPGKGIPKELLTYHSYLKCILPDFKQYFNPIQVRRMNTLIKSGNVCAIETMKEANIDKPDAIITGTGLGCVEDTEKFLHNMLQTNEGLLNPTAFIQSTHNTISAQVALHFKCTGYNVLFAHKTSSFEHALLDAIMLMEDGEASSILIGGFDEITAENYSLKKRVGQFKEGPCTNLDIIKSDGDGSIPGEGTTFFLLSEERSKTDYAVINSVDILSYCDKEMDVKNWIVKNLNAHGIAPEDIDVILVGINGDSKVSQFYYNVMQLTFKSSTHAYYKHLCGEFDTASGFAMWYASNIIKSNNLPSYSVIKDQNRPIRNVAIYNQDNYRNHSLILLSKPESI